MSDELFERRDRAADDKKITFELTVGMADEVSLRSGQY